jgi:hypothetical protein
MVGTSDLGTWIGHWYNLWRGCASNFVTGKEHAQRLCDFASRFLRFLNQSWLFENWLCDCFLVHRVLGNKFFCPDRSKDQRPLWDEVHWGSDLWRNDTARAAELDILVALNPRFGWFTMCTHWLIQPTMLVGSVLEKEWLHSLFLPSTWCPLTWCPQVFAPTEHDQKSAIHPMKSRYFPIFSW